MTFASHPRNRGFTLVELLVATVVMLVLSVILLGATEQSGRIFQRTSGKIEQFGEARRGFENLTRKLAEATLNTYWDYSYTTQGATRFPTNYVRQSELRFRSGPTRELIAGGDAYRPTHGVFFQAPSGGTTDRPEIQTLHQGLSTWGYFLEVGGDEALRPAFLPSTVPVRNRSRLMELRQPTERLSVYAQPAGNGPNWWFANAIRRQDSRPVHVLAENIVALVILPRLSPADEATRGRNKPTLCPRYDYDSTRSSNHTPALNPPDPELNPKNQLPPVVQVVMVAIDEASAARIARANADSPDLGIQTDDLFRDSARLEHGALNGDPGDGDLSILEQRLREQRVAYRVFSSNVAVRGAKWSRSQLN